MEGALMSKSNELTVLQKILDGHADVFGDLRSINDSDPIYSMLKRSVTPSKSGRPFKRQDMPEHGEQLTLLGEGK